MEEKICIMTDTGSDITQREGEEKNIKLIPLNVMFGEEPFFQEKEEDFDLFYEKLKQSKDLPTTSQPSPEVFMKAFLEAKDRGETVIVLTLSGDVSGTYNSACLGKELSEYKSVYIIDTKSAINGQHLLVTYACMLRDKGWSAKDIVGELEEKKKKLRLAGVIDTLTYLRKGGRIPAGAEIVGNLLHIKPAFCLEGVIRTLGKGKGIKGAKRIVARYVDQGGIDRSLPVYFGYSASKEMGETYAGEMCDHEGITNWELFPIGSVCGTHVGMDCVSIAYFSK